MTVATVTASPVLAHLDTAFLGEDDWEELEGCPVCRQDLHLRDVGLVEGGTVGPVMAACVDCELCFMRRRPHREWFARYYAQDWDRRGQEAVKTKPPRPATRVVEFCAEHLDPGSSVLDVGAGFGRDLLAFKQRGYRTQGLERSEHRARFVREVVDIPCEVASLEEYEPPRSPDLVFLNHVFEHLDDTSTVLEHARRVLDDGGLIYIAVPNLWAEHAPQTFHFVPHLSTFTAKSLTRLMLRHGLSPVRVEAGKEIQVLAAKTSVPAEPARAAGAGEAAGSESPSAFWRQVSEWTAQGFGARGRNRVLAWHSSKDSAGLYASRVISSGRLRYAAMRRIRGDGTGEPALHPLIGDRLPSYLNGRNLRMLPIRVSGDGELPMRVRYPTETSPVWVK